MSSLVRSVGDGFVGDMSAVNAMVADMSDRVVVTLDGTVHDADKPLLFADDLSAVRGDGVFETILVRRGVACNVDLHLARLESSAAALDLPVPDLDLWHAVVEIAAEKWGAAEEGSLRLVLSRGREVGSEPTAYATVGPLGSRVAPARANGVSVITLNRGFSVDLAAVAPWQLLSAKTLSYATNMAALRYAAKQGADDVIYVSSEGRVLEGPRSTVLVVRGKTLITPPPEHGVLAGTTVEALFKVAKRAGFSCRRAPVSPADLFAAESVWLISSITLAARVASLNGVSFGAPDNAHEITDMVDTAIDPVAAK